MSVAARTVRIDHAHPALPGHFPGMPVVPGVVLLGQIVAEFQQHAPQWTVVGIKKLKFCRMLLPEQDFSVEFGSPDMNTGMSSVRFKCWQDSRLLAEGNLTLQALQTELLP